MQNTQTIEIPITGMDCTECTQHVQRAIALLPGVHSANVFLASEKAVVQLDPSQVDLTLIRQAVEQAGYKVPKQVETETGALAIGVSRSVLTLFGIVFAVVVFVVIFGEWLGLFETVTEFVPLPIGVGLVLIAGYSIFRNVIRATLKRQVISHTLMVIGVIAALVVGEWLTAMIVIFFMRVGSYAEHFTTERSRKAVKDLTAMAPKTARVERDGTEQAIRVEEVRVGEVVIVRPGEQIPTDGEVISGQATVNQASITGESMPIEVGAGSRVFAATVAQLGSLRIRVMHVGADTTFGKVIRLVEEAEAHRADVQRIADKFSAYYLPVVATIAALTFFIGRDPLATAAVLLVACSCSFALATPIAMLASVGAGAKHGLLIKGGKYIELLGKADVVLVDKTGTLTLGRPEVSDIVRLNGMSESEILTLAASAERYSEHPFAQAIRAAALQQSIQLDEPQHFEAVPGLGIRAEINGKQVVIGNRRMIPQTQTLPSILDLEKQGKTALFMECDGQLAAVFAATDTIRPEVPAALAKLKTLGIEKVELLTGDNEKVAAALAERLGVSYQANLLPEDKIAVVKSYQAQGYTVIMIGDGVNDAPALAQADIGMAMGAAGADVAIEAAHVTLMQDDWMLVPEVLQIAHRTMRVVKMNIAFTAIYNLLGLSLAAFGFLPPVLAAAAQSLPDLGILTNSSRLLRYKVD